MSVPKCVFQPVFWDPAVVDVDVNECPLSLSLSLSLPLPLSRYLSISLFIPISFFPLPAAAVSFCLFYLQTKESRMRKSLLSPVLQIEWDSEGSNVLGEFLSLPSLTLSLFFFFLALTLALLLPESFLFRSVCCSNSVSRTHADERSHRKTRGLSFRHKLQSSPPPQIFSPFLSNSSLLPPLVWLSPA